MPVALAHAAVLRRPAERDRTILRIDWRTKAACRISGRWEHRDHATGRPIGPFAKDTRDLLTRSKTTLRLVVNLSEVTFVDAVGEEMLSWLARSGGNYGIQLLSPPRLRTPAFADGAETCPRPL
jgi:hypothetical protein